MGSIIPCPFLERGRGNTPHLTLDWARPSILPDHKKFLINLHICRTHDLEKIQQDKTNQVVANDTWLATKICPAKVGLVELHNNNFFRNVSRRGATWFSTDRSLPIVQPRYRIGVPRGIHRNCGCGFYNGGSSSPTQNVMDLFKLTSALDALQNVVRVIPDSWRLSKSPCKYMLASSTNSTSLNSPFENGKPSQLIEY